MKTLSQVSIQQQLQKQIKSKAITLFLTEIKHQSIEESVELNALMFDFMTALPAKADLASAYKAETGFDLMVRQGYSCLQNESLVNEMKAYFNACASIYDLEFDLNLATAQS